MARRKLSEAEVAQLGLEDAPAAPAPPARRKLTPEEVAALGLESDPGPKPSGLQALASGVGQAAFGFGDELGAGLQGLLAAGNKQPSESAGKAFLDTYRQARSENRQLDKASSAQHPWAYYPGLVGASVASMSGGGAAAKGLGALLKAGAKAGLKYGALGGLGGGEADLTQGELLKAALQTGAGAAVGGLVGAGLPLAGSGLSALYRGVVKPSAAAQLLRKKGADLTLGQMSPGNILAALEENGQSSPLFGRALARLREKGRESWQNVALNEGRAPGAPTVAAGAPAAEQLEAVYSGFEPAYALAKGEKIETEGLGDALRAAADDPGVYATPDQVGAAQRYLQNQMGLIDRSATGATPPAPLRLVTPPPAAAPPAWEPAPLESPLEGLPRALREMGGYEKTAVPDPTLVRPGVLGPLPKIRPPPAAATTRSGRAAALPAEAARSAPLVDSDALLQARSNLRREIAERLGDGDHSGARLLQQAEAKLTERLESGLSEHAQDALRATDAQYAKYKMLEDAVRRAGDQPNGFTPAQLSSAVRSGTASKGQYARGGGGPLREIAAAGRQVLDQRSPPTGQRLTSLATAWVPWLANKGPLKNLALGETGLQRVTQRSVDALDEAGLLQALQQYLAARSGAATSGP